MGHSNSSDENKLTTPWKNEMRRPKEKHQVI